MTYQSPIFSITLGLGLLLLGITIRRYYQGLKDKRVKVPVRVRDPRKYRSK